MLDVSIAKLARMWRRAPDQTADTLRGLAEMARHTAEDHVTPSSTKIRAVRIQGLIAALTAEMGEMATAMPAGVRGDLDRGESPRTSHAAESRADVAAQRRDA